MHTRKVGIIGCGTIGSALARWCLDKGGRRIALTAICDSDELRARTLAHALKRRIAILPLDALIKHSDFVVEAAHASVAPAVLKKCFACKKDCLIMSVGGLIGHEALLRRIDKRGTPHVYIPSGALSGVDGLKSALTGKVTDVLLTTRKPPAGLAGAPYFDTHKIDLRKIRRETVVFEGTAAEAIRAFPQNVNVSAVLSIAGIGARRTRVRIVTAPSYTRNVHEVTIRGSFGEITTVTKNVPSASNPKTSALAIYSAIAALKNSAGSVHIGA